MRKLTTHEQNTLAAVLLGTAESIEGGLRAIGIEPSDVDLADAEWMLTTIQTCPMCGWWFECCDLDSPDGYCYNCGVSLL